MTLDLLWVWEEEEEEEAEGSHVVLMLGIPASD